jgi:hypothetical protein
MMLKAITTRNSPLTYPESTSTREYLPDWIEIDSQILEIQLEYLPGNQSNPIREKLPQKKLPD